MSVTWSTYNRMYQRIGATNDVATHADDVAVQAMTRLKGLEQQVHDLSIVVVTLVEQLAAANHVSVEALQQALDAALAQAADERRAALASAENVWDSAGGPTAPLPNK